MLNEIISKRTGARMAGRWTAGKVSRSEKRKSFQKVATDAVSENKSFERLQNSDLEIPSQKLSKTKTKAPREPNISTSAKISLFFACQFFSMTIAFNIFPPSPAEGSRSLRFLNKFFIFWVMLLIGLT